MAILWSKKVNGKTYEVRTAGKSRRLYTDGVFHSQYNPDKLITGQVWDLLMLPAFFLPESHVKRILVLGVGGGAVIHQYLHFFQPQGVTGIELDPIHLQVARKFFALNRKNVSLINADAQAWVEKEVQRDTIDKYDIIIDDVFGEENGDPVRAIPATGPWMLKLAKLLNQNGVLICNFPDRVELRESGYFTNKQVQRVFRSAFQFTAPYNENAVGVFVRKHAHKKYFWENIQVYKEAYKKNPFTGLRYNVRPLSL